MKYYLLLALVIFFSCSETPNEVPVDSYRDVELSIDMNQEISSNLFEVGVDTLTLILNSTDIFEMEGNDNNIFTYIIPDLILGLSYDYQYAVNDTLEELDGSRSFTVSDENNLIFDYYGELNPTTLIFLLNMSYQIEIQNFNPDTQFIDVAGTFNDWDGTNYHLEQSDNYIYTITISDIEAEDELEFKFRINGDWENAEFPEYGENRNYTVMQGENILEMWYNNEEGN